MSTRQDDERISGLHRPPGLAMVGALLLAATTVQAKVVEVDLTIDAQDVDMTGETVPAITVNGQIPAPLLEFNEGDTAVIHVHNKQKGWASVHWHGLLVPPEMDGVPYVSFPGIPPESTFTYEFPLIHSGTYWYHSHTGFDEQRGVYGPIVIHPKDGKPLPNVPPYDREQVIVLSDWTNDDPRMVMGLLKSESEWYSIVRNSNQSLLGAIWNGHILDFLSREWESMPANEISDVAYDGFLMNGATERFFPAEPGEKIRARVINGGSSTYFYLTYGCGPMTIVEADGQPVDPVQVDRLLISVAETYDLILEVPPGKACELLASSQDGSGRVAGVFGKGEPAPAPKVPFPNYYINTMNAGYFPAMWRTAWDVDGSVETYPPEEAAKIQGMPKGTMKMKMPMQEGRPMSPYALLRHPGDTRISEPKPLRVVKLNLTGDMDRYVWSMNGKIVGPENTIRIKKGERVRFEMSNRTMMNHPMHLHGHFFRVINGQGANAPLKHTINVAPMETTIIEFDANEEKDWFFHCHILYHMAGGMERVVHYEGTEVDAATLVSRPKAYKDRWFAFGSVSGLSQMTQGSAQLANTHNIVGADFQVGYDKGQYDVTGAYSRYINRYLSPFAGVNAYYDEEAGRDVRGVFGLSWLLPLNAPTAVWVGTDGSFRWTLTKQLFLTRRLLAAGEVEYDTTTNWEYTGAVEYIVTRHFSVMGQYNTDYGWGGGIRLRLFSPDLFG